MDNLRGSLCLVTGMVLCACGVGDGSYVEDIEGRDSLEFRSDDDGGVLNPGGRPGGGGWISNGLEDPDVSGIDPAFPLSTEQGMSSTLGLVGDEEGQGIADYVVECALPYGRSITKVVAGQQVTFDGLLGLAPEWEDGECDQDCQEWVSACLLARTNVTGQTVQIWVKGDHEALGWEAPEGALLEAGFYGNLFADPEGQYYCKGTHQGIVAAKREGRTCSSAAGAACDFTKLGKCHKPTRCELVGPDGDVPANCRATDSTTYHTVATYVLP